MYCFNIVLYQCNMIIFNLILQFCVFSRFPTQENIEKKQAQKEEMMARGESMPQNDHSNRANGKICNN